MNLYDCTGDRRECDCPACQDWRENQEPSERTFDDQLGATCDVREAERAAVRLKR